MLEEIVTYPQYRKYSNGKSYFKIISEMEFEEIQKIGDKITLHLFKANILPDRNYIYDLTFNYKYHYLKCDEDEFETIKNKISYS